MTPLPFAKRFMNYSISTKLVLSFVLISLVSVAIVASASNYFARKNLISNANRILLAAAEHSADNLDLFLTNNLDSIRIHAQLPVLTAYLSLPLEQRANSSLESEVITTLNILSRKDQLFYSSYTLFDHDGIMVFATDGIGIGTTHAAKDYFQQPLKTRLPYVSAVSMDENTHVWILSFSSPVRDDQDKVIGVLRSRYDAAILQRIISQNNGLAGDQSFSILLDENYIRLAHGLDANLNFKSVVPLAPEKLTELQHEGRLAKVSEADLTTNLSGFAVGLAKVNSNEPYFTSQLAIFNSQLSTAAVIQLKTKPWLMVFAQPEEIYLAPIQAQGRNFLFLALGIAGVIAMVAFGIGRFFARPIVELTEVAKQVSAGNLLVQAKITSRDEIGQLAQVFNGMTLRLNNLVSSLEEQVQARMVDLTYSLEVGQRAAAIRDLAELLPTVTELIRDRFRLYYVQTYLMDDVGQTLILQTGTGTIGQRKLAIGSKLFLYQEAELAVQAALSKQAQIMAETFNEGGGGRLLSQARSRLAIPLVVEERVIGVLDLYATEVNAFTSRNLTVFEAMATQLSLSIDSAKQWALAQAAQQKSQAAIQQLTQNTWERKLQFLATKQDLAFTYNLAEVQPLSPDSSQLTEKETLSAPLTIQNTHIGQLQVQKPPEKQWSHEEKFLVETIASQLAQKAENLRLFEETQQQATREQITRQISDKIRASRNVKMALETAAEELTKALGVDRTIIDLRLDSLPEEEKG